MKRKISILIVLSILLSLCTSTVFAEEKELKLMYSAFFEEATAEDSVPYTLRMTGKDASNRFTMQSGFMEMVSDQNGNPGFEFRTGKKVKVLTANLRLRLAELHSDIVIWTYDHDDTGARLLMFTADGKIKAAFGNSLTELGIWEKGQWIELEILINEEAYSVFLDGQKVLKDAPMPTKNNENETVSWTKNIKSIKVDTYNKTEEKTQLDVAHIILYEGIDRYSTKEIQDYLKEQEELAAQEPEEVDPNAPVLFANNTFDDLEEGATNTGIGGDKKSNLVYIDAFPDDDNKSIRLESVTGDTFNVLTSFDTAMKEQFVWDFSVYFDDLSSKATLTLRDPQPVFIDAISFQAGGQIRDMNGAIGTYKAKQWYRLQLAVDVAQKKYSFWMDGVKLVDQADLPDNTKSIGLIRFHIYPPAEAGSVIHVDNWRVYEGIELLSDEYLEKAGNVAGGSHYTDHERMEALFKDKMAFTAFGPYYYSGSERKMYDENNRGVTAKESAGSVLIPLRSVAQGLGGMVSWDNGTVRVQIGDVTLEAKENEAAYQYNGTGKTASSEAKNENGTFLVPVEMLADLTGKTITQTSDDLYILEDEENKLDLSKWSGYAKEMGRYLLFDHPSQQEIIETLMRRYPNNEHPRIMATAEDFDRIRTLKDTDEQMMAWYENTKKSADNLLNAEPIVYTPSQGTDLLESARTMLSRSKTLGMMYQLTGEKKYKDALWQNIVTVCNFPDWYPTHFLDVGEMSMAVAIAYDWLYNDLTKEERKFIEDALEEKGLNVTLQQYETDNQAGYWTVTDNNWNVVCNGGAAVAALAIGDKNPELTGKVVYYALWGLESMMKEYAPQGGWNEGITYWQYATSYFTQLMSALNTALGSDYGFMEAPGVATTGEFVIHGTGPEGIFNFHDAGTAFYSSPEILWMSSRLNKPELTKNNLYMREIYDFSGGAAELLWYDPEMNTDEDAQLPLDAVFKGTEMATMRSSFEDPNGIYAALHGGLNSVNHGQLDNGTFVIDAVGERWFLELGGDSYSLPEYFAGKRYNYYRNRAEGQNTLVINPGNGPDQISSGFGKITKQVSKPRGAYSVLDMTSAYEGVDNVTRAMLLGNDRSIVTIRDEVKVKNPSELYWFGHTKADIEILGDGTEALLTIGSKQLYAKLSTDMDAVFSVMDPKPLPTSPQDGGQNANSGVKKLTVHATGVQEGYIQISFVPVLIPGEIPNAAAITKDTPIDQWDSLIPDGELIPFGADEILVDGEPIEDFTMDNAIYKVKYPFGTTDIPVVEAHSDTYDVQVQQSETMPGSARIIVSDPDNPERTKDYVVEFTVLPQIGMKPEGSEEIKPVAVSVSDEPQPENPAKSAIDGDLSTRWSAFGVQWIEFDLGQSYDITHIELAWMNGDKRVYPFEIYLSEDGENYENVLRSESSQTTNDLEMHQLPKTKARYVRVKCFGNNENEWCSLTEAKVYASENHASEEIE